MSRSRLSTLLARGKNVVPANISWGFGDLVYANGCLIFVLFVRGIGRAYIE